MTDDDFVHIYQHPHLIGHMIGMTDLTELHSKWIRHVWGSPGFTGLQAHRGSYKTSAVCGVGVIWALLYNPELRIAVFRKSFTMATDVVRAIRANLKRPEIIYLFTELHNEEFHLTRETDSEVTISLKTIKTPEPSIQAIGMGANITGRHFGAIIGDDLITLADRVSAVERERTKRILHEVKTNILDPGGTFALVGTPWHSEDAWGDYEEIHGKIHRYPVGSTGIISEEEIQRRQKSLPPSLFSCNYLLQHANDEDNLFSNPTYGDQNITTMGGIAHIDPAFGGGDYNAMTVIKPHEGKYHVKGFVFRGHVQDWIPEISKILYRNRCEKLLMETNTGSGIVQTILRQSLKIRIVGYHESENKHLKISTRLYEFWDRLVFHPDCDREYMSQIVNYNEYCSHDDAPDSLASVMRQEYISSRMIAGFTK